MTMTNAGSSRPPSKFTPQAIEKIKEYVKQGLSREKIAKSLDVTVGSLQVTCSRLGISLRRPSVYYPSYDRLKTQLRLQIVEKNSRPKFKVAITMKRKDGEWALDVPLSPEALGRLGIEAFSEMWPSGFIEPCLPSTAERPPSGPDWVHEIKHDGYRLMARPYSRLDFSSGAIQRWSAPIVRFAKLSLSTIISTANLSSAWPSIGSCNVIWR